MLLHDRTVNIVCAMQLLQACLFQCYSVKQRKHPSIRRGRLIDVAEPMIIWDCEQLGMVEGFQGCMG